MARHRRMSRNSPEEGGREARIQLAARRRLDDVALVLDHLQNAWNLNAIMRTAEGLGIGRVCIVEAEPVTIHRGISFKVDRWLRLEEYRKTKACLTALRKEGFRLICTSLGSEAKPPWEINLAGRVALILGNESSGPNPEAIQLSDELVRIPMRGLVRSLNVSVATGILIYELLQQRRAGGLLETDLRAVWEVHPGERD